MGGGVPGAMGGGLFYIGDNKFSACSNSKGFKKFLKINEKFAILEFLNEIFQFFENLLQFYRNCRDNLGKDLENFGNMHL